jgi:hypothetical protein
MRRIAALAAALLIPACGGGGGGGGLATAQIVVVNTTNNFTVSIVGFDYDGTVNQNWVCQAGQANLTIASSMSSGTVDVVIFDGAGAEVYNNSHTSIGGLTVQTRPGGAAGTWRVVMDFSDVTLSSAIVLDADTAPAEVDEVTLASVFGTSDFYTFHAGWGNVQANVSIGSVSAGTLDVVIRDGSNNIVFNQTITAAVNTQTSLGDAGTWTIQLDFGGATLSGSLSITSP